jgi:3-hydroxyisobutyrate dehydrogenase
MRVGFIGLGDIGKPMAERIARSQLELCVFDARSQQAADLVQLGACVARSVAEVAQRSDFVSVVVRTTEQVREVVLGAGGLLEGLASGSIIAIHSTAARSTLKEIGERCADRGVGLLDAPVSGGAARARAGSLACLVGGDPELLERSRPVIELFARSIFHLGAIGAGQAGKLVNNLLYFICMVGSRECMKLAVAAGVSEDVAAAVIRASSGNNFTTAQWAEWKRKVREEGAQERISALAHKDIGMALQMARELSIDVPLGALSDTRVEWAIALDE